MNSEVVETLSPSGTKDQPREEVRGVPQAAISVRQVLTRPRVRRWGPPALVALVALVVRFRAAGWLTGLYGMHRYDDGVYFTAAAALVHGRMPYRDFIFLHPPGIAVVLAPFAALGRWIGDADALVGARVAFIVLGAVSALLVYRLAARWGTAAAVFAGGAYALSPAAAFDERVTSLEALGTATVLAAVLLLVRVPAVTTTAAVRRSVLVGVWTAGALLSLAALTKIWNVVPVLVVTGWFVYTRRGRALRHFLGGAAVSAAALVVPFAVAAGPTMWRMVVLDQIGRQSMPVPRLDRLVAVVGLEIATGRAPQDATVAPFVIWGLVILGALLAWRAQRGRLWVVMAVGQVAVLIGSPTFYGNYAAFAVPALVLVLAAGASSLPRPGATVVGAVTCTVFAAQSVVSPLVAERFPGDQIAAALPADGCVTADAPGTLALAGVLSRNLERGCALPVDLSGFSMDVGARQDGHRVRRIQNCYWQEFAWDHLSSGSAVILSRKTGNGFTPAVWDRFDRMETLVDSDGVRLLEPDPVGPQQPLCTR
ncbi:MAG: glycosyltransferase family 39 protein [Micrococcales bacterium]|nr:glycosyltransferase family 39 protein [Micrococcales bacterium]MCL2667219.1 glycosyltransferase family 39 protein [Micrococcales bacterium]